jgi:hypothetical protein
MIVKVVRLVHFRSGYFSLYQLMTGKVTLGQVRRS